MTEHAEHQHLVPASLYIKIWAGLLLLTGVTVGASYLSLQNISVFVAIVIATIKASLVLLYFMHLRFEKPIFALMLLAALSFLGVCIGLSFSDYWYR